MCGERGEERGDAPKELGGMTRSVATSKQARKQARKQSSKQASNQANTQARKRDAHPWDLMAEGDHGRRHPPLN